MMEIEEFAEALGGEVVPVPRRYAHLVPSGALVDEYGRKVPSRQVQVIDKDILDRVEALARTKGETTNVFINRVLEQKCNLLELMLSGKDINVQLGDGSPT